MTAWEILLLLSILGFVVTTILVVVVGQLGARYRRELPKLPIKESLEALKLQRDEEEARLADVQDALFEAEQKIREAKSASKFLEDVRPEIEALQARQGECKAETRKAEDELARVTRELAAIRDNLQAAKSLEQGLAEKLDSLKTEHARVSGEIEGLSATQKRLLDSIEVLQETHASAGGVGDGHDPRQDLWEPYFPHKHAAGGATDQLARLEEMEQQLKGARVRIPQRTLYAFHTALKIQDISPLTVLAGISGTGKSLLPRLYAKCMGLHFLNLPVQPGWNSPLDLFGFYNYMEHKFKATPLTQALVQFDQFNRDSWPLPDKNKSLTDQVLLVLLDEMNLARVEYYFSELLSRLEIRRTIDASDPDERRKVEVPLEIGHALRGAGGEQGDFSVSLFPGENVLFSGTMNEDESTMSLSDKVLDRATVLRFGKPAEVVRTQPDMASIQSSDPLALTTWKRWLQGTAVGEDVQEVVDQLGEVMSDAGSAFGHRVAQGMLQYVSLYPDTSSAGQRLAMVDQIEQKVLPKLRGRDLAEVRGPLQDLARIVADLGDEQLQRAIVDGQQESDGTFIWSGLDRRD
jgi:hypothetical protein